VLDPHPTFVAAGLVSVVLPLDEFRRSAIVLGYLALQRTAKHLFRTKYLFYIQNKTTILRIGVHNSCH